MNQPAKAPGSINYFVSGECHPTAKLYGCNSEMPPKCAKAAVKWDKGCEIIEGAK